MRSIAGVGITPPKVLGTPKPASSVMISSTFGAPFGGTTRGAHHGFDCSASSLITPPNFGSGGGSCLPLMVVVAPGEPSVPVTCCAAAGSAGAVHSATASDNVMPVLRAGDATGRVSGMLNPLGCEQVAVATAARALAQGPNLSSRDADRSGNSGHGGAVLRWRRQRSVRTLLAPGCAGT